MPKRPPKSARIEAKAEADAIYLKLEAEARGQYEILAKKGEGLKQIVEACGGSKQAFQMLMLEHLDNLAEASAKAISNIKFDKIVVWEGGGGNGHSSTADFSQRHGQNPAADDASDERHRRRRVARIAGQARRRCTASSASSRRQRRQRKHSREGPQ